ncbi:D-alanyl-D-alanine carboxypeptidase family protein [Streptacidiphilus rugosus]|uniref:D-alanyl-D-alanine carboxypeptidase family protein n=1 Tax=Streptacidiphilus rugosus TaxID=405783 RepID=UPI00068C7CBD|nr:D-alanyl-D-alanine carboxypeptidase [Streptacidiphilus rugosus]
MDACLPYASLLPGEAPQVPTVPWRTELGPQVPLKWPRVGQAAAAVDGALFASSTRQEPIPTASTAKIMTALLFLRCFPLRTGKPGPSFTVSAAEAARYLDRVANGESLVPVCEGQRFTERQALHALLAVSANNIAEEIARWCAGSRAGFVTEMNALARALSMTSTRYTDPSGLDAATVSTATDQVALLRAALRVPGFREVAGSSYTDPTGRQHANTNPLLGRLGVFAGKTGTTTAAGRNLVLAARPPARGRRPIIIAVMAQPTDTPIATAAGALLTSAATLSSAASGRRAKATAAVLPAAGPSDEGAGSPLPLAR